MKVLNRIYFDLLEDIYYKPALAHNNLLEVHFSKLRVRHNHSKLNYKNKAAQEILDSSINILKLMELIDPF